MSSLCSRWANSEWKVPWGGSGVGLRKVCVCACVCVCVCPAGHPCTEGLLCTSLVYNTSTLPYSALPFSAADANPAH